MTDGAAAAPRCALTKADMYALGLSGVPGAEERRRKLLRSLALPEKLSPNAMLDVLGALCTREELAAAVAELT